MINQFNEDLNDAFELHFPAMSPIKKLLYKWITNLTCQGQTFRVRYFHASTVVTERIVEYTTVFAWLPEKGARILDIGCVSSRLPIQLASLGYEVNGLDTRPYRYSHCNFVFHQQDLLSWDPPLRFDTVYLISVLEHMGLGGYGTAQCDNADYQAIKKIMTLMQLNGNLIVSVPFGKRGQTSKHRIYDISQIKSLFSDFLWRRSAFFRRNGSDWEPCRPEELAEVVSPPGIVNGVAILDLVRQKNPNQ